MDTRAQNPELTPLLRVFIAVVVLVLIIGSGLFFLTDTLTPAWPWKIPPFNAHFLGAIYIGGLAGVLVLLADNRWAPARLALPMGATFTGVVSIASLLYLDHFNFGQVRAWLWFILYIIPCLISAYIFWAYRKLPLAESTPTPPAWRLCFLAEATLTGLYGIGMFVLPSVFTAFWPWKIDDFHARVYSALFITAAVGALMLIEYAARAELLMFGLSHAFLGFFAILGVIVVDNTAHRVDWSVAGTWVWMAGCGLLCIAGLGMLWQALAARGVATSVRAQAH